MTATATKTNYPDYREFGLYLLPRNHHAQYGFAQTSNPGRCLLLLDTKSSINEKSAKAANLRLLLQNKEKTISLYIVLPKITRRKLYEYPDQSELLQNLDLAYVARNQVITPLEITQQFRAALGDLRVDVTNLLDFSAAIGINHNGDMVYSSSYGRFVERQTTNDAGDTVTERLRSNLVPPADCLYALDAKGLIDDEALALCVIAYQDMCLNHMQSIRTAQKFAQTIFQIPPTDAPFKKSLDVADSIIKAVLDESVELDVNHWYVFNQMVVVNEATHLYSESLRVDSYLEVFDNINDMHNNRHSLHFSHDSNTLYKPAITVLLAPILANLLLPDNDAASNKIVYSPSIGDGTALSGFTGDLSFHVNEPNPQNFNQLSLFVGKAARINAAKSAQEPDSAKLPGYFISNKDLSLITPASDFALSIALLPAGVSPLTTSIPFNDNHGNRYLEHTTDRLDQSLIIEVLEQRQSEGRSIFIGPVEPNQIGKVGKRSVHILKWLQAYFFNVSVVDLSATLFNQNTLPSANRLYIIGGKKPKPDNALALHDRIDHLHKDFIIPLITSYEQLIGLEQAISLIERSKRIPVSDADITDIPKTLDNHQEEDEGNNEDDDNLELSDSDKPGIHFVDGFYNLNPVVTLTTSELNEEVLADNEISPVEDELQADPEPIAAVADEQAATPLEEVNEVVEDDSQSSELASTGDDDNSGHKVVFQDFTEYSDDSDNDFDDDTGASIGEEPDSGDFDLDILMGGSDELDAKMAAQANFIENNYLDGDNIEVSPYEDSGQSEDSDESDDNEDDNEGDDVASDSDDSDNEVTQGSDEELGDEGTDDTTVEQAIVEPPAAPVVDDSDASSPIDLNKSDAPLMAVTEVLQIPNGPRFIENPSTHLIKPSKINPAKTVEIANFHASLHEGADTAIAHKIAEMKNIALSDINDKKSVPHGLHRLTSLSLVETHLPAIVVSSNQNIETMQVISLINHAGSRSYNDAIDEFNKEHRLPGDTNDSMFIHELFSLSSDDHQEELDSIIKCISDINTWMSGAIDTLYLNDLYNYDSHDFNEIYRLAASYALSPQNETRQHIIKSLNYIIQAGLNREKEYQAWWWMGLDDVLSKLFALNQTSAAPNASLFSPYSEPAKVPTDDFEVVAKQIINLAQTNVYDKAFPLGVSSLAEYLVPSKDLALLKAIANQLENAKKISFSLLVERTISCHAIFIAGTYRFFTQNCGPDTRELWLDKLAQVKPPAYSLVEDNHYIARLALDVDYSKSLLASPTKPFISSAAPFTRYMSESTHAQSFSLIDRNQQPKVHNALLQMQTMWIGKNQDFDMTSWLILETLSNAKELPSEHVDILFLAANNLMSKRPSYFSVPGLSAAIPTLIPLLYKVAKSLNVDLMVCADAANADISECCKKHGIQVYQSNMPAPNEPNTSRSIATLYVNPARSSITDKLSITLTEDGFEHLIAPHSAPSLLKSGQALSLRKATTLVRTKLIPTPKNRTVLTSVYEQYTRVFDAMRQLKVLASAIAQDLFKTHLHSEHKKIEECPSLKWWFNNQDEVLYNKNPSSVSAYNNLISELQQKVRTTNEDLALKLMIDKTPLQLPSVSSCDVDAWVDVLANRLSLSLSTPQLIAECLDSIKNGIQPVLIANQEQQSLLHHIIVVEQGATLPLSYFTTHERAIKKLKAKPNKSTKEQMHLEQLTIGLNKGLLRRDSEISAIFQQNKKLKTPLIRSAIQCFLKEVQQFALTDISGTISYVNFIKEQSRSSLNTDTSIAFSQLVNTLIQMCEDSVITDLPLSPVDTIRTQIERHGYQMQMPDSLSYHLVPDKKEKDMWTLSAPKSNAQTDIHLIYAFEEHDAAALTHKTRHSSLILTGYPDSLAQLDMIIDTSVALKPIVAVASTVFISLTEPLCQADVLRQPLIDTYLSRRTRDSMSATQLSDQLAAIYYLATAPEYIDYTSQPNDILSFLGLVSQLPLHEQERHLSSFEAKRQVQLDYDHSKTHKRPARVHQSVFTRRYEPVARDDYSLFAHLNKIAFSKKVPPALVDMFAPPKDYIHDTYSQYGYKPVGMDDISESIIKLANKFKSDLFFMVDTHPHKEYLYQMLSDHSQNPEADYFIELSDDHKKAYIYKHLIKDMAYRGIVARISNDLYRHGEFDRFSGNEKIEISRMLISTQNSYSDIYNLCLKIQALTGISIYIEQLQAQVRAKHLITERVDAICLHTKQSPTYFQIPVLICQPKLELGELALSKNLPAITSLFNRHFSNNNSTNPSVYLGKNEWLVTCGITLPHYSQTIDLNNLICHVISTGVDTTHGPALFSTNGRHLYTAYVDKKALAVAQTHTVSQGVLSTKLFADKGEVTALIHKNTDVMKSTSVSTWSQLNRDLQSHCDDFGIAPEQMLIGYGEHAQYCLSNKDMFETVEFHDVAGKLNSAIKMTSYGKASYTDFNHLFKSVLPLGYSCYLGYLKRCMDDDNLSLRTGIYSMALDEQLEISIIQGSDTLNVYVSFDVSSKQALLVELLSGFNYSPSLRTVAIQDHKALDAMLQSLKPSSQWVYMDDGRDIDLVQSVISSAASVVRNIERTLELIPSSPKEPDVNTKTIPVIKTPIALLS